MFIFVQPMYSKQELNADSNYVVMSQLIRAMSVVRPDYYFIMPFPDAQSGYKYADDGFFKLHNVLRIPQRVSTQKMANAVAYDANWYNEIFRRYGFDLIWCNLVESAAALSRAGDNTYEAAGRPFLCVSHNYVIHDSLPYPFEQMQNVAMHQCIGALSGDINVFNSQHCKWMFFDMAKRWLNDDALSSIMAKSAIINYGTLEAELEPVATHNEVPVIAYNHRLQSYKNYKVTFDLLQELWDEGMRFKVRYMNNTSESLSEVAKYPFLEVKLCETRKEYLDALQGCDLNITNSQHETFCISAIESMALGQPLIAPNGITFPEIVGNLQGMGYPYLFDNRKQQRDMVVKMLTDADERKAWGLRLSAYVRREYNSQLWATRYSELWEAHTKDPTGARPDAREMVRVVIMENSGKTIEEIRAKVFRRRVNGRHPFSSQSMPMTKLMRLARELGAEIKLEGQAQRIYLTNAMPSEHVAEVELAEDDAISE